MTIKAITVWKFLFYDLKVYHKSQNLLKSIIILDVYDRKF